MGFAPSCVCIAAVSVVAACIVVFCVASVKKSFCLHCGDVCLPLGVFIVLSTLLQVLSACFCMILQVAAIAAYAHSHGNSWLGSSASQSDLAGGESNKWSSCVFIAALI